MREFEIQLIKEGKVYLKQRQHQELVLTSQEGESEPNTSRHRPASWPQMLCDQLLPAPAAIASLVMDGSIKP